MYSLNGLFDRIDPMKQPKQDCCPEHTCKIQSKRVNQFLIDQVFDRRKVDGKKYIGPKQGKMGQRFILNAHWVQKYRNAFQIDSDKKMKPPLDKGGLYLLTQTKFILIKPNQEI